MVFSDKKSKTAHHNKLNLRDTSIEPTNLNGDANLPRAAAADTNDDLNDRVPTDIDEIPPLENVRGRRPSMQTR